MVYVLFERYDWNIFVPVTTYMYIKYIKKDGVIYSIECSWKNGNILNFLLLCMFINLDFSVACFYRDFDNQGNILSFKWSKNKLFSLVKNRNAVA